MFAWWKWPLTSKEGRFTHRFFSEAHNSREIIRLHGATANLLDLNWSITMIIVNFSAHHQTRDYSCTIKAIPILRVIPLIEGALMKVCIYRLTKITSLHGNCLTLELMYFGHNEEHNLCLLIRFPRTQFGKVYMSYMTLPKPGCCKLHQWCLHQATRLILLFWYLYPEQHHQSSL